MVIAPHVKRVEFFIPFSVFIIIFAYMKYTRFILKKDLINLDLLKTNNVILQPPFVAVMFVVGIAGIFIVGGLLPMAVTLDGCRSVKYQLIMFTRKQRADSIVRKTIVVYRMFEQNNRIIVHGFTNVLKRIA